MSMAAAINNSGLTPVAAACECGGDERDPCPWCHVANPAVMAKFFDPLPTPAEAIAEAVAGMAQLLAQELIG